MSLENNYIDSIRRVHNSNRRSEHELDVQGSCESSVRSVAATRVAAEDSPDSFPVHLVCYL